MSITKRAFVTVGSTKFDDLIASILQEDILNALRDSNFTHLVVQCGESALPDPWTSTAESLDKDRGIQVEIWKYKPSIEEDIAIADLVISHAGSGTILDTLRLGKKLIVVPNDTLMDKHQTELADALGDLGYVVTATPQTLGTALTSQRMTGLRPFPGFNGSKFAELVDEEVGLL